MCGRELSCLLCHCSLSENTWQGYILPSYCIFLSIWLKSDIYKTGVEVYKSIP